MKIGDNNKIGKMQSSIIYLNSGNDTITIDYNLKEKKIKD